MTEDQTNFFHTLEHPDRSPPNFRPRFIRLKR